jgi:hypothetical protein
MAPVRRPRTRRRRRRCRPDRRGRPRGDGSAHRELRVGHVPGPPEAPWYEPLIVLARGGVGDDTGRLATGILIAPLRPAVLLAKQAGDARRASRGPARPRRRDRDGSARSTTPRASTSRARSAAERHARGVQGAVARHARPRSTRRPVKFSRHLLRAQAAAARRGAVVDRRARCARTHADRAVGRDARGSPIMVATLRSHRRRSPSRSRRPWSAAVAIRAALQCKRRSGSSGGRDDRPDLARQYRGRTRSRRGRAPTDVHVTLRRVQPRSGRCARVFAEIVRRFADAAT